MKFSYILFLVLILIPCHVGYSQSLGEIKEMLFREMDKDIPISHISVYEAADSLRMKLLNSGVDTVLLFYKTDNSYRKAIINEDGTDEHKYAFILWKSDDNVFIQRLNKQAIYEPVRTSRIYEDLFYLIEFYINHKEQIQSENLLFAEYGLNGFKSDFFQLSKTDYPLSVVDIQTGEERYKHEFLGLDMGTYMFKSQFFNDLDKLMYMWILLIERAVKKELKNNEWEPLNLKIIKGAEKEALFKKTEHAVLSNYYQEYYGNKEKSIILPKNYEGLISLIYHEPCGEVIEGDSSIVVRVPVDGVIGFKYGGCIENDMQIIRVGESPLLHFYDGKIKATRELLFIIDLRNEKHDENQWGVYTIDNGKKTYTHNSELKSYRRSLLYVGTYQAAMKLWNSKGINEKLEKEYLMKCYKKESK